jgi:hypothetical protein
VSARILLLAAALLVAAPARAAHIDFGASQLGGGSVVEVDLGPGTLAFDPAFVSNAAMVLAIVLDPEEIGVPLVFTALVDNLTGELWTGFTIQAFGAGFAQLGTVRGNGTSASVDGGATLAVITFADPGEAAGVDIGAFDVGDDEWLLHAGSASSFTLVLQPLPVPEPGTAALVALGLAGLAARRGLGTAGSDPDRSRVRARPGVR